MGQLELSVSLVVEVQNGTNSAENYALFLQTYINHLKRMGKGPKKPSKFSYLVFSLVKTLNTV